MDIKHKPKLDVVHGVATPPSATTETPGARKVREVLNDTAAFINAYVVARIRKVFEQARVEVFSSRELIRAVALLDESPYDGWWDNQADAPAKGVSARLARQLTPYGIHSRDIRFGGGVRKGYRRQDFQDAWDRHLAPEPAAADTAEVGDDLDVAAHTSTQSVREAPSAVELIQPFSRSEGAS